MPSLMIQVRYVLLGELLAAPKRGRRQHPAGAEARGRHQVIDNTHLQALREAVVGFLVQPLGTHRLGPAKAVVFRAPFAVARELDLARNAQAEANKDAAPP